MRDRPERFSRGRGEEDAYLRTSVEEEPVGVDAIANGAANEGEPVENDWGLVGALEQQLAQDIDDDGQGDEGQGANKSESPDGLGRAALAEQVNETREKTHGERGTLQGDKKGWRWNVWKGVCKIIISAIIRGERRARSGDPPPVPGVYVFVASTFSVFSTFDLMMLAPFPDRLVGIFTSHD